MSTPSADVVRELPYVHLLAFLGESNLPPGGLATIRDLASNLNLRPGLSVLHAGCNAGFLSRELSRRTGASILGVDISSEMAEAANLRAKEEDLDDRVRFERQDMRDLPFEDGSFDVVLSGGAMAFVQGHEQAVGELVRVTKEFGLIGDSQFYYPGEPSDEVLRRVSEIIEVPVPRYTRDYWLNLYPAGELQEYWRVDGEAGHRTDDEVVEYSRTMADRRTEGWDETAREALFDRLVHIMSAFNENMKQMRYTAYVYRRISAGSEPALFV